MNARISSELEPLAADTSLEREEKLMSHIRALWDERNLLIKAGVLGALLGIVIAFAIPVQYESSVKLMPPDAQSSPGLAMVAALAGGAGGLGPIAGDLLGVKSSSDQFVGILHSRTLEDSLIQRFDLKNVYGLKLDEDARKRLGQKSRISVDRKSGIIEVAVEDHDPHRAAAVAEGYVEELDHLVATLSTSAARRERIFLEERLKTVKQDLDRAASELSEFSSKNTTIDPAEQGKTMVQAAATLQGELIAAQSELKGLEQIYSPGNVRVRSVQARIRELQQQQQLGQLGGAPSPHPASDADQPMYPSLKQLPILAVTYSDLYRQTKIQEAVYESLTKEYELAKVEEAKETPSVKVLDRANLPERKSFPPRTLITLLCIVLSLSAASFWVFATNRWNNIDVNHPAKVLAQEVAQTITRGMPWTYTGGTRWRTASHYLWLRKVGRDTTTPGEESR